jgi:hypothetical protein
MATSKKGVKAPQLEEEEVLEEKSEKKEEFDEKAYLKAYYNEPVTLELFKDNDKYKDDVFVCVNGKRWQIQRGVRVTVPRYVAEEVRHHRDQRGEAEKIIAYFSTTEQELGKI